MKTCDVIGWGDKRDGETRKRTPIPYFLICPLCPPFLLLNLLFCLCPTLTISPALNEMYSPPGSCSKSRCFRGYWRSLPLSPFLSLPCSPLSFPFQMCIPFRRRIFFVTFRPPPLHVLKKTHQGEPKNKGGNSAQRDAIHTETQPDEHVT